MTDGKIDNNGNLLIKRARVFKEVKCPHSPCMMFNPMRADSPDRVNPSVMKYDYCNCSDWCAKFGTPKRFLFWTFLKTCFGWRMFWHFEDQR